MISYCFSLEYVEDEVLKSHIFIFWNQKLRVENLELLNLHKRLTNQSLIFGNIILISPFVNTLKLLVQRFDLQGMGIWSGSDSCRHMRKPLSIMLLTTICIIWLRPLSAENFLYCLSFVFFKIYQGVFSLGQVSERRYPKGL